MKNLKLKVFAVALLLLCSMTAFAQKFEVDGIYYNTIGEDAVEVAEIVYGQYMGDVTIPSTVEYKETTYSVTSIGDYAFSNCSSLTSVTIPNSVTSIGDYAFKDCSGMTSITIPNSVTSIADGVFYGCM